MLIMINIRKLHAGGIIPTYRCTAACRHCVYGCSGKSDSYYINEDESRQLCDTLVGMGCPSVHIGGGEPFLNFDALLDVVATVGRSGLHLEYIETNAYWCKPSSADQTVDRLKQLKAAGANCLLISVDPFHIEYVPLERPLSLIELCRHAGMDFFVWQQQYVTMLSGLDSTKTYKRHELETLLGADYIRDTAHRYGLSYNGRALNIAREYAPTKPYTAFLDHPPCRELLGVNHYHADYNGYFIPPGCTGIGVTLRDACDGITRDKYPVFSLLAQGGVSGLYADAANCGFVPSERGYVSKCDLCLDCRRFLLEHRPTPDLYPHAYYRSDF